MTFLFNKISIFSPTFSSLIQGFSSSPGTVDSLLFSYVSFLTSSTLSYEFNSPTLIASATGLLYSGTTNSFYYSAGAFELHSLRHLLIQLACNFWDSPMHEDWEERSLNQMKNVSKDQRELDMCVHEFDVSGD